MRRGRSEGRSCGDRTVSRWPDRDALAWPTCTRSRVDARGEARRGRQGRLPGQRPQLRLLPQPAPRRRRPRDRGTVRRRHRLLGRRRRRQAGGPGRRVDCRSSPRRTSTGTPRCSCAAAGSASSTATSSPRPCTTPGWPAPRRPPRGSGWPSAACLPIAPQVDQSPAKREGVEEKAYRSRVWSCEHERGGAAERGGDLGFLTGGVRRPVQTWVHVPAGKTTSTSSSPAESTGATSSASPSRKTSSWRPPTPARRRTTGAASPVRRSRRPGRRPRAGSRPAPRAAASSRRTPPPLGRVVDLGVVVGPVALVGAHDDAERLELGPALEQLVGADGVLTTASTEV